MRSLLRKLAAGAASLAGLFLTVGVVSAGPHYVEVGTGGIDGVGLWRPNRQSLTKVYVVSLNDAVLSYARDRLHQKVGSGQCWDLVDSALRAAGADASGDGAYVFGTPIDLAGVAPGDCLQFEKVSFKHTDPNGAWYVSDYPHHSAVVSSVSGRSITVLNQNVGGDMTVQYGTFNLDDRQPGGTIQAYRPK